MSYKRGTPAQTILELEKLVEKEKEGTYKATWKRDFKLPWREAGPPNHLNDKVDSDQ